MADSTKIEWTDATWNVITGCKVLSAGCKKCYAMKLAGTRLRNHPSRIGLTQPSAAGPVWNGLVRFNDAWLLQPIQWKRARQIFVCAHADLFYEEVPDEWIDKVFAVMALAQQHTFQVLTKRSARMREYITSPGRREAVILMCGRLAGEASQRGDKAATAQLVEAWNKLDFVWPLENVWLGVSCEDQRATDERVLDLLLTPAAIRWISAEPLLGEVDLTRVYAIPHNAPINALKPAGCAQHAPGHCLGICEWRLRRGIDWVVSGGESGIGARPTLPDNFRSLRDQCAANGTAFLHKQNGEWVSVSEVEGDGDHHQFPDGATVRRIGKKKAGRTIDGVVHDAYPEATHG